MTSNPRTTSAKSKAEQGTNVTGLIATLYGRGRSFTDARNTLIAHVLSTGVRASVIIAESGVDKGDVSRIANALADMKASKATTTIGKAYKSVASLDVSTIDVDTFATVEAIALIGATYFRRIKRATGATGGAAAGKGQGKTPAETQEPTVTDKVSPNGQTENTDMLATVFDFLVNAPDFALARALILSAIDRAEIAVAEATAEQDAA
jgi:hypothetical protein